MTRCRAQAGWHDGPHRHRAILPIAILLGEKKLAREGGVRYVSAMARAPRLLSEFPATRAIADMGADPELDSATVDMVAPVLENRPVEYRAPALPGLTLDDIDSVERYVGKAPAGSTKGADASDWRIFRAWCDERTMIALPAAVAAFLGGGTFRMEEHSRHKSLRMVSEYVRNHELFRDHAGDKFL